MKILALFILVFSIPSFANGADQIDEFIEKTAPECKSNVIELKSLITTGFASHLNRLLLNDIEESLKIRDLLISEGAVLSQAILDEKLASKLSNLLGNNYIIEEQRASLAKIKETLKIIPLKVNEWYLELVKSSFEKVGI